MPLPIVEINYDKLQTAIQHAIDDEADALYPANDPRVGHHVRMGGLRAIVTLLVGYGTKQYHETFVWVREQIEAGTASGTIAIELLRRIGVPEISPEEAEQVAEAESWLNRHQDFNLPDWAVRFMTQQARFIVSQYDKKTR